MTSENKKKVREMIVKDSEWVIIDGILGEDISPLAWNKEVKIIYQDMDNQPCVCFAVCIHEEFSDDYFIAISGAAKGLRMHNVIAYKMLKPCYEKCKGCTYWYADADDCFFPDSFKENPDCRII